MKKIKFTPFQIAVHIGSLVPLAVLIWDYFNNNLTYNPLQEATLRTGKTALILLMLSLACTPLNTIFGFRQAIKVRRPLGVYAFMYAAIHFYIFIGLDYGFNLEYIKQDLVDKAYILVGLGAFLILLPLALTSTKGWKKRLKRGWTRLHKLVYIAGILVVIHYIWVVKSDIRQPLLFGLILSFLLLLRVPAIRKWASRLDFSFESKSKQPVNIE